MLALVERQTWGVLFRLMLFPRMALRSAKHGGKARVGSTRDHCNAGVRGSRDIAH